MSGPYTAPLHVCDGVVVDNVDPEGLHRVRVDVPGVTKLSAWARPLTAGGGSPQRGGHIVPAVGADVAVWFTNGDVERPLYQALHWGKPPPADGQPAGEQPISLRDAPAAEAHLVQALQLGSLVITFDEREGQRKLALQDVESGDSIVWDLESKGLRITMTSAVIVESRGVLSLNGLVTAIKKRLVTPSPKAL